MAGEVPKKRSIRKNGMIAVLLIGFILLYWQIDGRERLDLFMSSPKPMTSNEYLDMFQKLSQEACTEKDTNKYKIPEDECRRLIRRHHDECARAVAAEFPGAANTPQRMLLIGKAYTTCVFVDKKDKGL